MVHDLAPTPECIVGWTTSFGEPGHAALEGVAMDVGKTGNGDAGNVISAGAGRAFGDCGDSAVGDGDPNVARPARWQQSVIKKEFASQIVSPLQPAFAAAGYCSTIGGLAPISIEF